MKFLGVASWRGWGLAYSDGMCTDCSARARAEWSLPGAARPSPVPRPRSLRPDFALATGILLITVGVAFGVLIGPPPRTASVSIDPASSVANHADRDPGVGRGGGVTAGSTVRGGLATDRPAGATAWNVADALATLDHRPIRITRVAARRPARAAYQPVTGRTTELMEPVGQSPNTLRSSSEEVSPLDLVPIQAP